MRLALIQTSPRLGRRESNLAAIEEAIGSVEADVFCLPELCTSGYAYDSKEAFLELAEGRSLHPGMDYFQELSQRKGAAVIAGFPYGEEGRLFNASGLFRPGVEPMLYRKLHLFARERRVFEPGDRPPEVAEFKGARLGMMICFDWLFPEVARLLTLAGADVIVHPSNLVTPYCQRAMFARALENSVFIATANRVGTESYPDGAALRFTGGSQVMGHRGDTLLELPSDGISAAVVEFEPRLARDKWITPRNHILKDRRTEFFGPLCGLSDHED